MKSPCIKICRMNKDGLCEGCGRTRNEIACWSSLSDEQRELIMQSLAERMQEAPMERGQPALSSSKGPARCDKKY